MATKIKGDTFHRTAGINPFREYDSTAARGRQAVADRIMALRWLLIDEISMVSTNLMADVETELCTATREAGTYKKNARGETHTFGGLNVVLIGDFWQLDPPEGTSLCKVPDHLASSRRKYASLPRSARGLEILHSVQGVTELTEPARCKDKWYNAVLEECRFGRLSDDN